MVEMLIEAGIAMAVIVGLSGFLAVLLIVADALLLDYGQVTIMLNDEEDHEVEGGKSLLATLKDEEIFVPSACGGRGSCGLCKVKVSEGAGPLLPTEAPHLTDEEIEQGVRLSCQIKVRGDMRIQVPEEILSLQEYRCRVESIADLNYDTRKITLDLIEPDEMEFRPGQYIQLETPPYGLTPEPVYRAYSIASRPDEPGRLELIIRRVPKGICTTYVFELLEEGDQATINGPYGEFYLRESDRRIVFIAGGSGIAPIRCILFQMQQEGIERDSIFFYGANERRDLYLVDEMRRFERELANFRFVPALAQPPDEGWDGETGLVTEVVDRYIEDAEEAEAYLCGAPAMIDAAIEVLEPKGLTGDRAFYDKFA